MNLAFLMRTALVIPLFVAIIAPAHPGDIVDDLAKAGLIEKKPPTPGSEAWKLANWSDTAYHVEISNSLVVRKATDQELYPERMKFDARSFNYIGINRGEFGGGLYVGEVNDRNLLFRGNVVALMSVRDDLYIFSGLCHLSISGGAVHVIRNYRRPATPTQITLLPDAPMAVSRDKHWNDKTSFAIADCNSLMIFVPDAVLYVPVFDAFWSALYPNSIVGPLHYWYSFWRSRGRQEILPTSRSLLCSEVGGRASTRSPQRTHLRYWPSDFNAGRLPPLFRDH